MLEVPDSKSGDGDESVAPSTSHDNLIHQNRPASRSTSPRDAPGKLAPMPSLGETIKRGTVNFDFRTIKPFVHDEYSYASNKVNTGKYNILTYVPKNLAEQFRRIANIYFLVISILQVSTDLSPTNKYATILPLTLVLMVTLIKEGVEDYSRHKADERINNSIAHVVRGGELMDVKWKDVLVGDVIRVKNGESVPADFVILSTSGTEGMCYIETSNLDGETNLKLRQSVADTRDLVQPHQLAELRGELLCENPNMDLYTFEGTFRLNRSAEDIPVGFFNVVWRGCRVMNTDWIHGMVVFTGHETKLMMNSRKAPAKRSNVEVVVDKAIFLIFTALAVLCSVSTYLHSVWLDKDEAQGAWYIPFINNESVVGDGSKSPVSEDSSLDTALAWITFLILYNNLVPISLYVSLEVVKLIQSKFINMDSLMYHRATDTPALARTSNLNEDLGQIEYVFSDKTGTLTCNEMEFKKCSIGGVMYGEQSELQQFDEMDEVERRLAEKRLLRSGSKEGFMPVDRRRSDPAGSVDSNHAPVLNQPSLNSLHGAPLKKYHTYHSRSQSITDEVKEEMDAEEADRTKIKGYNFEADRFLAGIKSKKKEEREQKARLREFLRCIGLCHTVIPEKDEETGEIVFKASSPDEVCLVTAARELGCNFYHRGTKEANVNYLGEEVVYDVLNVNEFHSDRKRMSVVTRSPEGKIVLYCKGADEVMIPLLADRDHPHVTRMVSHLTEFGIEGLRTLVLARAELDPKWYADWDARYLDASTSLDRREEKLRDLAAEIEKNLHFVGATAIEDKLQDGVPETIEKLTRAGIKVWMLTGDKLETAQNIAFSCRLLNDNDDVVKIDETSAVNTAKALAEAVKKYQHFIGRTADHLAIVITGKSLTHVYDRDQLKILFVSLCKIAKVVVACRVIPAQKAQLVKMIRVEVEPEPITLAIGDGANDVAMIQEAHVGVGISGNEGMQAVRSADYAFAQFRFLVRLLLVHGRWNYRRVSLLILYSFYKNIANVLTLFYYGWANGFSGTTLYESWLGAGWNVGWTLFPVLFFGTFEQDLIPEVAIENPHCYGHGQRRLEFNIGRMARWVLNAFVHSIIIYGLCFGAFVGSGDINPDGDTTGLFLMGTIINFCTVLTVNYRIALETQYWVWWSFVGFIGSVLIWIGFVLVYSSVIEFSWDFYGIGLIVVQRPMFYLLAVLVPFTAVVPDLILITVKKTFFPTPIDILQELQAKALAEKKANGKDFEPEWDFEEKYHLDLQRAHLRAGTFSRIGRGEGENLLIEHLLHLRSVLAGDEEAIQHPKDIVEMGNRTVRAGVTMNRFTLVFKHEHDLEREFRKQFVQKSVQLARKAITIVFWLLVAYSIFIIALDLGETIVIRLIVVAIAALGTLLTYTSHFRRFFNVTLTSLLVGTAVIRVLLVTENGAIGMGMYAIFCFLVMRFRFIYALSVVAIDFVFYNVWTLSQGLISTSEIIKVDFLHLLLVLFAGYIAYQTEYTNRIDFLLQKDYEQEQARNQIIIDNIMPEYITQQMKEMNRDLMWRRVSTTYRFSVDGQQPMTHRQIHDIPLEQISSSGIIANDEGIVSILFIDIMGFSDFVATHTPESLVAILDAVYSTFDELCVKNGVQKMETVGKTYMACAGLEGTRADHAHALVEMAEEIISLMGRCLDMHGDPITCRIGIHTGRVISGVVGLKRPQFSLFGDTVNTASRMQSTGEPGHIHLSQQTYSLLKNDYRCRENIVDAKGLGKLKTYFVEERVTRLIKNRRHELVQKRHTYADIDVVPEAMAIVEKKTKVHNFDPYTDTANPVEIDPISLRFRVKNDEEAYKKVHRRSAGVISRLPLAIAFVFVFLETFWDVFDTYEEESKKAKQNIFYARFGYCLLLAITYLFTHSSLFRRRAAITTSIVYGIGLVLTLSVPLQTDDLLTTRVALIYIFLITLMSNSGTIRFLPTVILNIFWTSVYVTVSNLNDVESDRKLEDPFFVGCAACINIIATYAREYYLRREFVLTLQVKAEKDKAEGLLYQMLPESVAETLKDGQFGIANEYSGVSLLYSDIKGFTKYSSTAPPEDVVSLLADLFTAFDLLTDKFKVYKVQTIGDAYVVCGGLPVGDAEDIENLDAADHADNTVKMGMGMLEEISKVRTPGERRRVQMRIGIHTGTIIAGCIGTKQLRYDIWGTDCLVANSLESAGIPGGIVVSDATRWHLEAKYVMKKHTQVKVKGKGMVQSYKILHAIANPNHTLATGDEPKDAMSDEQYLSLSSYVPQIQWSEEDQKEYLSHLQS